jgi:hypothetical protein
MSMSIKTFGMFLLRLAGTPRNLHPPIAPSIHTLTQCAINPIVHPKMNAGKGFPSACICFHVISARQV